MDKKRAQTVRIIKMLVVLDLFVLPDSSSLIVCFLDFLN
jgi:hypothetical protein